MLNGKYEGGDLNLKSWSEDDTENSKIYVN